MVLCQLGSSVYIAAQFYPCYATFIPTAIIVGFTAAPMVLFYSFFFQDKYVIEIFMVFSSGQLNQPTWQR